MSFRFQRRVTILPGVRLNFSKSGVYGNLGLPGTGLNYRTRLDVAPPHTPPRRRREPSVLDHLLAPLARLFFGPPSHPSAPAARTPDETIHSSRRPALRAHDYLQREPRPTAAPPSGTHAILWERERAPPLWRQWLDIALPRASPA